MGTHLGNTPFQILPQRQEFTFVYAPEIESGELKIDDKSKEAVWLPLGSAVDLPLAESQPREYDLYAERGGFRKAESQKSG